MKNINIKMIFMVRVVFWDQQNFCISVDEVKLNCWNSGPVWFDFPLNVFDAKPTCNWNVWVLSRIERTIISINHAIIAKIEKAYRLLLIFKIYILLYLKTWMLVLMIYLLSLGDGADFKIQLLASNSCLFSNFSDN